MDIKLPENWEDWTVTSLGGRVFDETKWEKYNADSSGFLIIDGILLRYIGSSESIEIPDTVRTIGKEAFSWHELCNIGGGNDCTVKEVTIGSNVKVIDDKAFADSKVSEIHFDDGCSIKVGEGAFARTPWLKDKYYNNDQKFKIGSTYYTIDKKDLVS